MTDTTITKTGLLYHTIRVELLRRQMKLADFAVQLGCTTQAIADRLKEPVTIQTLETYGQALGATGAWLLKRCVEERAIAQEQGVEIEPLQVIGVYTPQPEAEERA